MLQKRFDDFFEYNTQLSAWCKIQIKLGGPTARSFLRVILIYQYFRLIFNLKAIQYNGDMYMIGGFDGQRRNDMYKIDLNLV